MPQVKKRKFSSKYKRIDKDFLSIPRNISVIERFIGYLDSENFTQHDLQQTDKIEHLLKFAFDTVQSPDEEHVQSVKALFFKTTLNDFKSKLYQYSAYVATFLWVDRVQKIVTDPIEKQRILTAGSVTSSYKLYCSLKGINYVKRTTQDLMSDRNVLTFAYTFRCSAEISQRMRIFINNIFREDFNEDEKNNITHYTRSFL